MKRLISLILVLILSISLTIPVSALSSSGSLSNFTSKNTYYPDQFTDVPSSSWCAGNVAQVYKLGLMMGNSATTFNPNGSITEAQALAIAARIHKIYTTGNDDFSDIEQEMANMEPQILEWCGNDRSNPCYQEFYNAWYTPYAYYYSNYVQYQYPEEDINNWNNIPNYNYILIYPFLGAIPEHATNIGSNVITRKSFVEILAQALPEYEFAQINTVENDSIPDITYDESFEVYRFYRAGIAVGSDSEGTFYPGSTISRGAVAAIITRMVNPSLRQNITLRNKEESGNSTSSIENEGLPISQDAVLKRMAALGIDYAYQSAKYPTTLHLNRVTYSDKFQNGYGDLITRMVLRCYAGNAAGGYGDLYVVVLCCDYETTAINDYYWDGLYFSLRCYSSNPGMESYFLDNAVAMNAYTSYMANPQQIPYD